MEKIKEVLSKHNRINGTKITLLQIAREIFPNVKSPSQYMTAIRKGTKQLNYSQHIRVCQIIGCEPNELN